MNNLEVWLISGAVLALITHTLWWYFAKVAKYVSPECLFIWIFGVMLTIIIALVDIIRYPIAAFIITLIVYSRLRYALYLRNLNKKLRIIAQTYAKQLVEQLRDYQLIWVELYGNEWSKVEGETVTWFPIVDKFGYEPRPVDKVAVNINLFIPSTSYFERIHEQNFSNARWQLIELRDQTGVDNSEKHLIIVLILNRHNALPLAIPFYGSAWLPVLQPLQRRATLWVYPLAPEHAKTLTSWIHSWNYKDTKKCTPYFKVHIAPQPHLSVEVPPFSDDILLHFWEKELLDRYKAFPLRPSSQQIRAHQKEDTPPIIPETIRLADGG